jgi:hypothetical protein
MSRTNRRRTVRAVAPVAGLLAAGLLVWQGSYAAFSATTNNTADAWSTGNLILTNNGGLTGYSGSTGAIFAGTTLGQPENNIKIGATGTKCITVQSGGSFAGNLALYRGLVTGTGSVALAPQIGVTIDAAAIAVAGNVASNCIGFPTTGTITNLGTNVALSAYPSTYAAATPLAVAAGTQRVAYRITWTLNSTGSNAGDNLLQGATAQADLNWEIQ